MGIGNIGRQRRSSPAGMATVRPIAKVAEHGHLLTLTRIRAERLKGIAPEGGTSLMVENEARFCPICRGAMEFLARYYIWRCAEHWLFVHNQLQPHEQIKIGEFTWMRKNGETYVDRPLYHG